MNRFPAALRFTSLLLALVPQLCAAATRALPDGLYAEIGTPRGAIFCELFFEKTPLTVTSFVGLAEGKLGPQPRKPLFDGLKFHRVVPNFVVQGGDPTGTGSGDPGYKFSDEFVPGLRHDAAGVLSMANDGPDTNGSQFFLTLRETNRLNYLHTVFGKVVRGLDLLPQIKQGDPMTVKIHRIGAAAKAFKADEAAFSALVAKSRPFTSLASARIAPGPTAHFHDPDKLLPADPPRATYFNFKLANFERTNGLKIVARVQKKAPPAAEDKQPGQYMRTLAETLGTAQRGALAVYFAEEGEWRVWIGDETAARFVGRRGTAKEFTASGAMHEMKEAFLNQAKAEADATFAAYKKTLAAGKQPPTGQQLKLHTDAILDGLIMKLEPRP